MNKVSPLANTHKLGLYGNYKTKNETDLLVIREISDVKIFQLSKYKMSNMDLSNVSLEGYNLPTKAGISSGNSSLRIQWHAPNTWKIISEDKNIVHELEKQCPASDFAITDLSHSRAIIEVKGNNALNVIKKGSPLNLNNFVKNNCMSSVYHGITISLDMINDEPFTLYIMAQRSFADSFYHAITDASLEFGFKAI